MIAQSPPIDATVASPLLPALLALDGLLAAAVAQADAIRGPASADVFRGLHLGPDDVARELGREPCSPAYGGVPLDALHSAMSDVPPLEALARMYQLEPFECSCLLLALAPEVDPRYERIYAYLQDDVTRKHPTGALAIDLFCADVADRIRCGRMLAPDAPLFRERLFDRDAQGASRLSTPLTLDPQILRYLLETPGLDARLSSWCALQPPDVATLPPAISEPDLQALARLAADADTRGDRVVVHLTGAHGTGKWRTALAIAARLERPLLTVDLRGALPGGDAGESFRLALRAATLHGAVSFLHGYDALVDQGERQALRTLVRLLGDTTGVIVIGATRPWREPGDHALPVLCLSVDRDDLDVRLRAWSAALARHRVPLAADALAMLADRFRMTSTEIDAAVASARRDHDWHRERAEQSPAAGDGPAPAALARAARAHCGHALAALARRIVPRRRWSDLVLPPESMAMLREICARVVHRSCVFDDWGFDAQLSLGKGVAALLAGPSGTGKTLASEVVAAELGLDLFQINLANVVSKYIGETEKNLDRIFDAAHDANAVLLFDEAEALFGKRSEVHDAHDRYANLEIAYLLQRMEAFEGLAILSTNMRQNIDDAFTRRLAFTVHFPFPEEADRRRIWEIIWPAHTPVDADVDAAFLARELTLSGGHIRNAALAAAFYAASDGGVVTRAHVMRAARREFQKMGKVVRA